MKQGVDRIKFLAVIVDNFVKLALNYVKKSDIFIYAVSNSQMSTAG